MAEYRFSLPPHPLLQLLEPVHDHANAPDISTCPERVGIAERGRPSIYAPQIADEICGRTHLRRLGPTIESLVSRPTTTSHVGLSKEERTRLGIDDSVVRFSAGIEESNDLIADIEQAIQAATR